MCWPLEGCKSESLMHTKLSTMKHPFQLLHGCCKVGCCKVSSQQALVLLCLPTVRPMKELGLLCLHTVKQMKEPDAFYTDWFLYHKCL